MTVLSAQTIRKRGLIEPCRTKYKDSLGNSAGLSACSYDITIDGPYTILPQKFVLASAVEYFNLPSDVVGIVHDKSSLVRLGLTVQNTVLDPGWRGFLTLELINYSDLPLDFKDGDAIAQVVFHLLDEPTQLPYVGKYQDQEAGPQASRAEK